MFVSQKCTRARTRNPTPLPNTNLTTRSGETTRGGGKKMGLAKNPKRRRREGTSAEAVQPQSSAFFLGRPPARRPAVTDAGRDCSATPVSRPRTCRVERHVGHRGRQPPGHSRAGGGEGRSGAWALLHVLRPRASRREGGRAQRPSQSAVNSFPFSLGTTSAAHCACALRAPPLIL